MTRRESKASDLPVRVWVAILCVMPILPGGPGLLARQAQPAGGAGQDAGALKSTEQQKVETQVLETKTVVVIQQANPQVIYVPTDNPVVVYGPSVYPYPAIIYPPPPPPGTVSAGMAISSGISTSTTTPT